MSGGNIRHWDIRLQRQSISVRTYSSLSYFSLIFVLTMGYASVGFRKTAVESDHCPDAVVINLGHWMDELANIKRLWGRWESTRLEEGDDIGVANNLPM